MAGHTSFVDSFLGVDGPGSCLPGPYLPLGQVRLGPDVIPPYHPTGYRSDHPITRFSHTHVSGTGGAGKYGNIGITPFVASRDDPDRLRVEAYAKSGETARPGFYGVMLEPAGIRAELTVTQRTGLHRYTFPTSEDANVLIDIGAVIECAVESGSAFEMTGVSIGGYAEVASPTELVGRADLRGGWGHDFPYSVYFCLRLDRPAKRWILGGPTHPRTIAFATVPTAARLPCWAGTASWRCGSASRTSASATPGSISTARSATAVSTRCARKPMPCGNGRCRGFVSRAARTISRRCSTRSLRGCSACRAISGSMRTRSGVPTCVSSPISTACGTACGSRTR